MLVLDGMVIQAEPPVGSRSGLWEDTVTYTRSDGQKKPFILLIEDNPGDVLLVEEALREHRIDCDFTVLSDGEQAILLFEAIDRRADRHAPTLVLLDLNLPKRSGHEVLSYIRRSSCCSTTPVVIVSSSQVATDLTQTSQLGIAAYFHKPANFDAFLKLGALVRDLL